MSFIYFLIPFIIATAIISLIALLIRFRTNKSIVKNKIVVANNVCSNLAITSDLIDKVNDINSIPNDLFRRNKSTSCFDFLHIQEKDLENNNCENSIIYFLGGKI